MRTLSKAVPSITKVRSRMFIKDDTMPKQTGYLDASCFGITCELVVDHSQPNHTNEVAVGTGARNGCRGAGMPRTKKEGKAVTCG
jgi:hypothetical protein